METGTTTYYALAIAMRMVLRLAFRMYTAMSTKYLEAKYFDIHGGGMDLKFHYH
jgi:hypothetical protein